MMDDLSVEELRDIVKSLCSTLSCAVCLGVLPKDILTCVNGHCICTECQVIQENCPTCRKEFSNLAQNSLVRHVLDIIPHKCQYNKCSYLVKAGDDHESYCRFKPTPCEFCKQEVAAVELADHFRDKHSDENIFEVKTNVRAYNIVLEEVWCIPSLHSAYDHFLWLVQSNNPTAGVVSFKFKPVLCGKPSHDIYVKISFMSEDNEYDVSTKIKMNTNVNETDENCLLIPVSVVRKEFNKDEKEFSFEIGITKTKQ